MISRPGPGVLIPWRECEFELEDTMGVSVELVLLPQNAASA